MIVLAKNYIDALKELNSPDSSSSWLSRSDSFHPAKRREQRVKQEQSSEIGNASDSLAPVRLETSQLIRLGRPCAFPVIDDVINRGSNQSRLEG